jgi:hypothetical protein
MTRTASHTITVPAFIRTVLQVQASLKGEVVISHRCYGFYISSHFFFPVLVSKSNFNYTALHDAYVSIALLLTHLNTPSLPCLGSLARLES